MTMAVLADKFGRAITDLRISVTDRCNNKCVYCRTGNEGALYGDLPFADYLRMVRVLVGLGVKKVRITGGEPLLRKGVVDFVCELAKLRNSDDEPLDLAMTTNGDLLAEMAWPLKEAGLGRVTVSMDAVDPDRFARITRVPRSFERVLAGVRAARTVGLGPVTLPWTVMESVLLGVPGLRTSAMRRVSTSPELTLRGSVKVTTLVPPPLSAAVTRPLPDEVVASTMLKKLGLSGNTVPLGASSRIVLVPAIMASEAWTLEIV